MEPVTPSAAAHVGMILGHESGLTATGVAGIYITLIPSISERIVPTAALCLLRGVRAVHPTEETAVLHAVLLCISGLRVLPVTSVSLCPLHFCFFPQKEVWRAAIVLSICLCTWDSNLSYRRTDTEEHITTADLCSVANFRDFSRTYEILRRTPLNHSVDHFCWIAIVQRKTSLS